MSVERFHVEIRRSVPKLQCRFENKFANIGRDISPRGPDLGNVDILINFSIFLLFRRTLPLTQYLPSATISAAKFPFDRTSRTFPRWSTGGKNPRPVSDRYQFIHHWVLFSRVSNSSGVAGIIP